MPLTRFVIRTYYRMPVRCDLYYMGEAFLGKGTVMNLSCGGFQALGDYQVMPAMELVARLSLPGKGGPVGIQRAVVRWVRGLFFGVKMERLDQDSERRLKTFLSARLRLDCGGR